MNTTDLNGDLLSTHTCLRNVRQISVEFTRALLLLIFSTGLLYMGIYSQIKRVPRLDFVLMLASLGCFCAAPWLAPIHSGPIWKSYQNYAVSVGVMKALDITLRRHALPKYTASSVPPSPWLLALLLLTEYRYESFTPNRIRVPREGENFSEPTQLALNTGAFLLLQLLPQDIPTIVAFEVLLAIYINCTGWQLLLRYKNSPSLFGPLYLADSLTGFWSDTWHNSFAAFCESLAYRPARDLLPRYGVPIVVARSVGVLVAFMLMAVFHVYLLYPILPSHSLFRIGMFFVINGVATICEAAIWGRKRHWLKAVMAWTFETYLASWAVETAQIPNGVHNIPWRSMFCGPVRDS